MKPVAQNIMHTLVCIILTYNIIDCRAVSQGAPGSRQQPQGRGEEMSCGLGLRAVEWWFGVKAGLNWNPSYGCKLSWDKICMSFFFFITAAWANQQPCKVLLRLESLYNQSLEQTRNSTISNIRTHSQFPYMVETILYFKSNKVQQSALQNNTKHMMMIM